MRIGIHSIICAGLLVASAGAEEYYLEIEQATTNMDAAVYFLREPVKDKVAAEKRLALFVTNIPMSVSWTACLHIHRDADGRPCERVLLSKAASPLDKGEGLGKHVSVETRVTWPTLPQAYVLSAKDTAEASVQAGFAKSLCGTNAVVVRTNVTATAKETTP